jgi:hypothetical protein
MIERLGIQIEVFRDWATWRGKWPSPRVRGTPNQEYLEGKVGRGGWQIKVVSVIPEMGCHPSRGIAGVAQTHPRMNREFEESVAATSLQGTKLRAPAMDRALLPKVFQFAKMDSIRGLFDLCDRCARVVEK